MVERDDTSGAEVEGDAKLTLPDGREISLPYLKDAAGNHFIDVRKLYSSTHICTFDPGYTSTGSCQSKICYIDGQKGVLLYRGYRIEDLVERGDFADAAYLLLHGDLPSAAERRGFSEELTRHTLVHEQLIQFYKGFRHDAHPMAIMVGVVGALSAFYNDSRVGAAAEFENSRLRDRACMRLISKMPTLAAIAYKTAMGQAIMYPRNDLSYAENFLHMLFAVPTERYEVDPLLARALEVIMIVHMDHEQNASTSTVRTAGSSQANPFACIASGIAALWGPAHGGANEAVLQMLEKIGTKDNIPAALARAKDKKDSFRLMGFGHRVYKTYDPRARVMQRVCYTVLSHLKIKTDPLLEVAMELEKLAMSDEYFKSRGLYPNVDFYSGIVLRALGIPVSMYTVLFAVRFPPYVSPLILETKVSCGANGKAGGLLAQVARTVGWVSQWKEMAEERTQRISRPRQIYMGHMHREFVPIEERGGGGPRENGASSPESSGEGGSKRPPVTRTVSTRHAQHYH